MQEIVAQVNFNHTVIFALNADVAKDQLYILL